MVAVVTIEEVMENIKNTIIASINYNLLHGGETEYIIGRADCGKREIAIEIGKEIAELYRQEGYDVDIYEYGISNREAYIRLYISI